MGITRGQRWERKERWECSETTGLTWLPSDKPIALGICLVRCMVSGKSLALPALGAAWKLCHCVPESELKTV